MSDLIAVAYDDRATAEKVRDELAALTREHVIEIEDAVVVERREDGKIKLHQTINPAGAGAAGGALWGGLIGLIFLAPLLGMAIGAGMGALTTSLTDVGVDDDFIKKIRDEVTEGTSALFVLSANEVPDRLASEIKSRGLNFKLVASNLTAEQEAKLREVFEAE